MPRLIQSAAIATSAACMGCILPVSTGAPMPATTVGKGRLGGSMSAEAPVLDLLTEGDQISDLRGAAPAAGLTVSVSYGIGDDTDLEAAGEGALYYFILPLPTGGSLGIRHHLLASETFDIAIAGKIGTVGGSATSGNSESTSASATYGALQGVVQRRRGWVRPMAAINLMPFQIRRDTSTDPETSFKGLASSVTLAVMAVSASVQFGPYVTYTSFASERFSNGFFPSFGLMFAVRPDRNRAKPAMVMPQTPYYGPPPPVHAPPPPAPGSSLSPSAPAPPEAPVPSGPSGSVAPAPAPTSIAPASSPTP